MFKIDDSKLSETTDEDASDESDEGDATRVTSDQPRGKSLVLKQSDAIVPLRDA